MDKIKRIAEAAYKDMNAVLTSQGNPSLMYQSQHFQKIRYYTPELEATFTQPLHDVATPMGQNEKYFQERYKRLCDDCSKKTGLNDCMLRECPTKKLKDILLNQVW